ncbi:DUF2505 domain-containing protein [Sorangium atrum]|jgi:hypothetical protein|uniref:DUF2505 domain-containing protein n=1 Tax=Sorangium atrum TaxID=2995308 RepID=A0ABT5C7Q5_9BACT|nr:DUF2505 domain-containing protein [Sorangium aterium]MDC0681201.1 DUF2505 domain-containing protein [Sorangium aterium]
MGKFTLTHEINCNLETFWKLFLDKTFNEELYRKELGFPEFTITEQVETATEIIRRSAGKPKMNLPGPVEKLLGSGFRYTEEGRLNKATKVWTFKLTPSTLADKMRNEGVVRAEAIGDNKVRRTAEITIEAKVFGVGGMLESSAEKELRQGWELSAVFMNKWIAQGKAA